MERACATAKALDNRAFYSRCRLLKDCNSKLTWFPAASVINPNLRVAQFLASFCKFEKPKSLRLARDIVTRICILARGMHAVRSVRLAAARRDSRLTMARAQFALTCRRPSKIDLVSKHSIELAVSCDLCESRSLVFERKRPESYIKVSGQLFSTRNVHHFRPHWQYLRLQRLWAFVNWSITLCNAASPLVRRLVHFPCEIASPLAATVVDNSIIIDSLHHIQTKLMGNPVAGMIIDHVEYLSTVGMVIHAGNGLAQNESSNFNLERSAIASALDVKLRHCLSQLSNAGHKSRWNPQELLNRSQGKQGTWVPLTLYGAFLSQENTNKHLLPTSRPSDLTDGLTVADQYIGKMEERHRKRLIGFSLAAGMLAASYERPSFLSAEYCQVRRGILGLILAPEARTCPAYLDQPCDAIWGPQRAPACVARLARISHTPLTLLFQPPGVDMGEHSSTSDQRASRDPHVLHIQLLNRCSVGPMLTYSESSIIPQSVFDYKWDSCLEAFEAQLQVIELDRCGSVCTSTQLLRSNIVLFRQLLLSQKCDQRDTECHTIGQIKNAIRPVSNFASKFREAHIMLWFLLESNLKNYDSCMRQVKACDASGRIVIPQPLKFLRAASQHHQNQQSTCSNKLLLNLGQFDNSQSRANLAIQSPTNPMDYPNAPCSQLDKVSLEA